MDTTWHTRKLPQFTGTNYSAWKYRVEMLLNDMDLKFVLNPESTEDAAKLTRGNSKACNLIIQCISDEYLEYVRDYSTAIDMLDALATVFQRRGVISKFLLRRKLMTLKYTNGPLEKHFFIFDSMVRELESISDVMQEDDKVCNLLLTLPDSFNPIITVLEAIPDADMSLEAVKGKLLNFELKNQEELSEQPKQETSFGVIQCHYCKKNGHKEFQCYKKKAEQRGRGRGHRRRGFFRGNYNNYNNAAAYSSNKEDANDFSFIAMDFSTANSAVTYFQRVDFILDSGATDHLMKIELEKYATNVINLENPIAFVVANGNEIIAEKKGEFKLEFEGQVINFEALLTKGLSHNLISIHQLTRKGVKVIFDQDFAEIKGKTNIVFKKVGKVYRINFKLLSREGIAQSVHREIDDGELWHRRLGHLNRRGMAKLGFVYSKKTCDVCAQSKATRLPFQKLIGRRTRRIGELIHSDVCGPLTPTTDDGERYFQVIIDDYSHFVQAFVLKEKGEATGNLINFIKQLENQHSTKVWRIRTDQGKEFNNNTLHGFAESKGIKIEMNCAYTSQQNGVSERMNRTLMDKARSMLKESGMPKMFWPSAVRCAAYVLNRCPSRATNFKTPSEIWFGENNLSKIHIFGCKVFYTILPRPSKLDSRGAEGRFIGYCSNGYYVWDINLRKVVQTRDVIFDESGKINEPISTKCEPENEPVIRWKQNKDDSDDLQGQQKYNLRKREKVVYKEPEESDQHTSDEEQEELTEEDEIYMACTVYDVPKKFEEAIKHEDSYDWKKAMEREMKSIVDNNTWTTVQLPTNVKPIETRWVFAYKEHEEAEKKFKARLVARGFMQTEELKYSDIYAPVAKMTTIRTLLAIGTRRKYFLHHVDITTAFLNGEIKTDVYIIPPKGFERDDEKVYKLQKALYGLKESSKAWNSKFTSFLSEVGFRKSKNDNCLFVKDGKDDVTDIYMVLYVDDIILAGASIKSIEEMKNKILTTFKAKDKGNLHHFLGINIEYSREKGQLCLDQKEFLEKILIKFNMENCNPVSSPMDAVIDLRDESAGNEDNEKYLKLCRSAIGSLLYVALSTRPDLTFVVGYLSRFQSKGSKLVWTAIKRVLRYIKGTLDLTLIFKRDENAPVIIGYADADWGSDVVDRKSTSGYLFQIYGCTVEWKSTKQQAVARSTAEAEYYALSNAAVEGMFLLKILKDFKILVERFTMFEDNMSVIKIASTDDQKRLKHIDIHFHFIKDLINPLRPSVTYMQRLRIFSKMRFADSVKTKTTALSAKYILDMTAHTCLILFHSVAELVTDENDCELQHFCVRRNMASRRLGRYGITIKEMMDMLEEDDLEPVDVFIEPPEANILTDEDSDDDEELDSGDINCLTGRQLRAATETVNRTTGERVGGTVEEDDLLQSVPLPSPSQPTHQHGIAAAKKVKWVQGDLEKSGENFPEPEYTSFRKKSAVEIFELFFDENCIKLLHDESQRYSVFRNLPDPNITEDELRCFLGILLLSGYDVKPNLRCYWDSEIDLRNGMVYQSMRRERFKQIKKFLHCADNLNCDLSDKAFKIRPLMDIVKKNCLLHFVPEQDLDFDESMVKYFGRHGCKQFIRGKPVRFGYKMWCLNSSSGYLVNFDLYQGKNPKENSFYENLVGKAAAPLLQMTDQLPIKALNYHFYTDNLFTCPNLLVTLKARGYGATGTMRENRLPKGLPLTTKKTMLKKERGALDSKIDKTNGIMYIRWKDNGVVTVGSTVYGVEPKFSEKRFSRQHHQEIKVDMPAAIKAYNKGMGGTDLMDQNIARHRVSVRGKKWWWCLFTWILDVSVHNAWVLYRKSNTISVTQLEFRREIVKTYLGKFGIPPKGGGRQRLSGTGASVADLKRYDRLDHLVAPVPEKKRRRCAAEGCSSVVRTQCNKCNVGLCIEDFASFHCK